MTDRTALADDPWEKLELWLFRECNSGTRQRLWALFGLPVDEITNHGTEKHALRYVRKSLEAAKALRAEPTKPVDREAVAKAICKAWDEEMADEARLLHEYYEPSTWEEWLPQANAAIAAMGGE